MKISDMKQPGAIRAALAVCFLTVVGFLTLPTLFAMLFAAF